jgi:hypothetical protein
MLLQLQRLCSVEQDGKMTTNSKGKDFKGNSRGL